MTTSKSPLPQFPSTSSSTAAAAAVVNAVNSVLNGNNNSDFRSGLPSIDSNDTTLNDTKSSESDPNRETNEFFGILYLYCIILSFNISFSNLKCFLSLIQKMYNWQCYYFSNLNYLFTVF